MYFFEFRKNYAKVQNISHTIPANPYFVVFSTPKLILQSRYSGTILNNNPMQLNTEIFL